MRRSAANSEYGAGATVAVGHWRANGRRDGAGGDARDLAEQAASLPAVGAQPLRNGEHDLSVRHGREEGGVQLSAIV